MGASIAVAADDAQRDCLGWAALAPVGQGLGDGKVQPLLSKRPRHEDVGVNLPQNHRLPNRVAPPLSTLDQQQPTRLRVPCSHAREQLDPSHAHVRKLSRGHHHRDVPALVSQHLEVVEAPSPRLPRRASSSSSCTVPGTAGGARPTK